MWKEFNIKTFAAETLVYRDGIFCPELSTLKSANINKKLALPAHIIYIGEIAGKNDLNINISAQNQQVFLSVRVKNNLPAFLNIFIKNTGKNSELRGHVMLTNNANLTYNCTAHHMAPDTGILIKTKIIAEKDSTSVLSGTALIDKNCENVISDIGFSALADKTAKITFTPAQRISAIPCVADHSAAYYHPSDFQIQYLRGAGLATGEVQDALREAFMNDFPLF